MLVPTIASSPVATDSEGQVAHAAAPVDDALAFLGEESAGPRRRAGPQPAVAPKPGAAAVAAEQMPTKNQPAAPPVADAVSVPGLSDRSSQRGHPHRSKKKKKGLPSWLITTIAALSVAAVVGIGLSVYISSQIKPRSSAGTSASANDSKKAGKTDAKSKYPLLAIDWPENQRAGAELFVNDEKREIPLTGPIEIPLPPSKEQYHFRLQRRGFRPKVFARASGKDDQGYTVSQWEAVTQGLDWPQDIEAAKKTAAADHKNVLVVFDASDSKESRFASNRFIEAVALRKEFRERAGKAYVSVYIDNPQEAEAQGRVDNADRNRKLTEAFGITVFPTVVVADPQGRPFGILEGYKINGINAFLEILGEWQADSKTLFDLLAKTDKGAADPDLARKALDFLEMNKLERFYADAVNKLTARLPTSEEHAVTKEWADHWKQSFWRAAQNPDEAKRIVGEFDQWKKTRTFKDPDMGAVLHLAAASILARLGPELRKEAAEKCKEGLAFKPHDPYLRSLLEQFSLALSGKSGVIPVGSGTGFCIAEGNYVLTNYHVIEGAKEIKVHLNGDQERHPAKLIADSETDDMALLKIDLPAGEKLVPMPLAETSVAIGEDVCALGFPSVMSQNSTLTFTKGVVSTVPDPRDEDGFIATDCRVNPGNSGGPLCNFSGNIAGMVTAKSHISSREDSYGLVIPADRLRKFLMEKLPRESRELPPPLARTTNLKADEIGKRVALSVVYIENLQEMRVLRQDPQQ
jgi:S1-C subfamily serine protease/thioredoxin-related protein